MAHTRERQSDPLTVKARVQTIGLIPSVALVLAGAGVLFTATTSGGAAILALSALVLLAVLHQIVLVNRRFAQLHRDVSDLSDRAVPGIVRRLLAGERVDLDAEIPWLRGGSDEIGQLALAFNRAERTAIAATLQESETRRGARNVFLNIAHRNQVIVHRQLAALDRAERSENDPDQLELLFQLDHLATRSRRNAENLIILNGGKPGRQWRKPVPLHRIVDAAIAETEHYTRVDAVRIPETSVVGSVVADLAHLLAELVDNATAFSPPHTRVEVRGDPVAKGVAVRVEDQGLGLDPEYLDQINATMRTPPDFGRMALSGDSRLGVFVVAQLAARHEMKVTLQESAYGGTSAVVLIPAALIDAQVPVEHGTAETSRGVDALTATSAEPSAQPALAHRTTATTEPTGAPPDSTPNSPHPEDDGDSADSPAVNDETAAAADAQDFGESPESAPEGIAAEEQDETPATASAPTGGNEAPLPRRRPRESLPQELRGSGRSRENEPDNDAGHAEFAHLAMTAFQRGTREARQAGTTNAAAGAHPSGDHHEHDQVHSK